ncbi:MAG: TonB-dependent receptor [Rudanella sp.]|nr:TonB-dependent receptor [Rudanella sp.]
MLFVTVLLPFLAPIVADSLPAPGSLRARQLTEVVVSASRVPERVLRSPVSVEILDERTIRKSAQPSYFDAIENLKGVQLLTPSLGFKVYNTRGFANTTNVRFVQLVDGRDNQAPHIGAPIANALSPSDLDIKRVEIIAGTASALYGMNALNGLVNLITKDPFESPGLTVTQKTGVNHIGGIGTTAKLFSESSFRYAHIFGSRLAFKVNLVYQRGYDWMAQNDLDLNPNANKSLDLLKTENPAQDPVNSYGNESPNRRTLRLNGSNVVVARTGFTETETTDYRLRNLRGDLTVQYRIRPNTTIGYTYQGATLDNVYQRTNRFRLDNYRLGQHSLTVSSPSVQFRAYRTAENTGDSYNIRSMAENIDRSFKSDNAWFADFTTQFNARTKAGTALPAALQQARQFADKSRPAPGSDRFNALVDTLRTINNWDVGAALRVQSWLYHAEVQFEPTRGAWQKFRQQTGIDLLFGAEYRQYVVYPDGNYFINPEAPGNNLTYSKTGGFVQATRTFLNDRLKLTGSVRADKNKYFAARLNPRLAMVYSPTETQHIRVSYQNGYRFPSLFEAFSNVNSGGVKRVGGLPLLSAGIFERSYFRTSIDAFQAAINTDVNTNKLTTEQAIQKNKGLLKPNTYTYIKPEQVNSYETGYKGLLFDKRLLIDLDVYYTRYRNFMAQVEANSPRSNNPDSLAYYLADHTKQDRYRLWTNSKSVVHTYGSSLGIRYSVGSLWAVSGNASLAQLSRTEQGDGLEEAFNTPRWIANVGLSRTGPVGFAVNYKYQSTFVWQSSLATGRVPAIHTVDAQVNGRVRSITLKLGATNLLNRPYYTFVAGPSVGGFYYVGLTYSGE